MKEKRNTSKFTCLDISTDERVGWLKCCVPNRCLRRHSSFSLSFLPLSILKLIYLFVCIQHFSSYYGKIVFLLKLVWSNKIIETTALDLLDIQEGVNKAECSVISEKIKQDESDCVIIRKVRDSILKHSKA